MVPPGVVYLKSISSAPGVAAAAKVWESALGGVGDVKIVT